MVSSKNVKVSQKRCLGTSTESFTGSSPSDQIIDMTFIFLKAPKRYRNLINNRTEVFCSVFKIYFYFGKKTYANLDFETKIAEIRWKLIENFEWSIFRSVATVTLLW